MRTFSFEKTRSVRLPDGQVRLITRSLATENAPQATVEDFEVDRAWSLKAFAEAHAPVF